MNGAGADSEQADTASQRRQGETVERSIAVVEDEVDLCDLIGDMLEMEGYTVIAVKHPDEIGPSVAGRHIDLFLIDIMLPRLSGIELAQQLRGKGYAHTPMIAMSASTLMTRIASQSGVFDDAIDKPFEIADLLGCIRRYLQE